MTTLRFSNLIEFKLSAPIGALTNLPWNYREALLNVKAKIGAGGSGPLSVIGW